MVQKRWTDYDAVKDNETSIPAIKEALRQLFRQLMSDVPYGVLLSGGFFGYFGYSQKICAETYRVRRCC
jgi:hypothetical protein